MGNIDINNDSWLNYDKWLFQPATDYSQKPMKMYMLDSIKLLLEDKDFFNKHIKSVDQNYFGIHPIYRKIVCEIKNHWKHYGEQITLDELFDILKRTSKEEWDFTEADEIYNYISQRQLTESRINYIKRNFMYWNAYVLGFRIMNMAKELSEAITNKNEFLDKMKNIIESSHKLEDFYVSFNGQEW